MTRLAYVVRFTERNPPGEAVLNFRDHQRIHGTRHCRVHAELAKGCESRVLNLVDWKTWKSAKRSGTDSVGCLYLHNRAHEEESRRRQR